MLHLTFKNLTAYKGLMRTDRPIGTYLVLWPALWGLCLASNGLPSLKLLLIFSLGAFLMRSAGCVINDFADRKIDGKVKRTAQRPLATGAANSHEALQLFVLLCAIAFSLVLLTNKLTVLLSFGALATAALYPFMKRYTHLPQVVLGAAFGFSIPMAFAAVQNQLPSELWWVYLANLLWVVIYDTFYAMVDRDDDVKIGVKSTAILMGKHDRLITAIMQVITISLFILIGQLFSLGLFYYLSLLVVIALFVHQQLLIKDRQRDNCFKAFLNNNWVGMVIFIGILLSH